LNVGQGDATLIITPDGEKTLIDTGPNSIVAQETDKSLSIISREVDNILLTHPDLDHVGGTKTLLARFLPKNLIFSTENTYEDHGLDSKNINNTQNIKIGKVVLEILAPNKGQFGNSNHNAIVSQIKYSNFKFIFMADADLEIERSLVSQGYFEKDSYINILKVGHHGSDTSSSEIFLKAIKPKYCIISVGKDNKYGHPKQIVLDRLIKYCGEIYRTDQDGGVEFKVKGTSLYISKDS
jgi:beta-lactamase superfamily II metal-dependent hydrolase